MPITTVPLRTLSTQRKDNLELVGIGLSVTCDGTNNTLTSIHRRHRVVYRDENGAVVDTGEEITTAFKLSDLPSNVQTGLVNFMNALDTK